MEMPQKQSKRQWPEWVQDVASQYEGMDDDALIGSLNQQLDLTRENLVRLGVILTLAEERGLDLGALDGWRIKHVAKRVAQGQLLPEIATRYVGHNEIFRKVQALPISEQRKVAEDRPIPVTVEQDGDWTHKLLPPSKMEPEQANQVFAGDHIRDEAEQRNWLEKRIARRQQPAAHAGPYVLDKRRRLLRVTEPCELSADDLLEIVQKLTRK